MPRIPWNQVYPAMDQHPPKWVRSADGSHYAPDFSGYPADAPRARVTHRDPLTGVLMLELPTVGMEVEDVDDGEPGDDRGLDDAGSATEADAGAAPDAA